jgi:hypothetical protein
MLYMVSLLQGRTKRGPRSLTTGGQNDKFASSMRASAIVGGTVDKDTSRTSTETGKTNRRN